MKITKEEKQYAIEAAKELFNALPRTKQINYLGHLNTILIVLDSIKVSTTRL